MSLLRLEKVVVDYGSIHALKEIDIDVNTGEVITLIGANGHIHLAELVHDGAAPEKVRP